MLRRIIVRIVKIAFVHKQPPLQRCATVHIGRIRAAERCQRYAMRMRHQDRRHRVVVVIEYGSARLARSLANTFGSLVRMQKPHWESDRPMSNRMPVRSIPRMA